MARGTLGGRAWRLAVLATLLAVAPVNAHAATPRAPHSFAGVNFAFYPGLPKGAAGRMARGGVSWVRFSMDWYAVEPRKGVRDWSLFDETIGDLASRGIEPVPILFGTPSWAADTPPPLGLPINFPILGGPSGSGTAEPPNATADGRSGWTAFVRDAVRRYGPGGSYWDGPYQAEHPGATPRPVRTWQVWNEPNLALSFWPEPSASEYAQLLRITDKAIKGVDPGATIVLGGLPCRAQYSCVAYLDDLYAKPGIRREFDVVDIHPYSPDVKYMMRELRDVRATIDANHDRTTRIWAGEFGWGSAPRDSHYNQGPRGQAARVRESFRALLQKRRALGVARAAWFDWRDAQASTPQHGCTWCAYAGLYDVSNRPKPAWRAFLKITRRLRRSSEADTHPRTRGRDHGRRGADRSAGGAGQAGSTPFHRR